MYVLIHVGGRGKLSSWSAMQRAAVVGPLGNIPPTSALAADATICFRILHYMWIGPFASGGSFGDFSGLVGSFIR